MLHAVTSNKSVDILIVSVISMLLQKGYNLQLSCTVATPDWLDGKLFITGEAGWSYWKLT